MVAFLSCRRETILFVLTIFLTPILMFADTTDLGPTLGSEITLDGIHYDLYDGKAWVMKGDATSKVHVSVPSKITHKGKTYTVQEIAPCAFFVFDHIDRKPTNPTIMTVSLPNTITKIGNGAFSGNKKLVSINIPNSVTEIERGAFERCYSLVSIVLPEGLTQIDEDTFRSCKNLKSIEIPASVEKIGKEAFSFCDNLETVTLLNPNTIVHEKAFNVSPKVKVVGWNGKTYNSKKVIKIFMVDGRKKYYSEENILNHFKSKEEAEACCIGELEVE